MTHKNYCALITNPEQGECDCRKSAIVRDGDLDAIRARLISGYTQVGQRLQSEYPKAARDINFLLKQVKAENEAFRGLLSTGKAAFEAENHRANAAEALLEPQREAARQFHSEIEHNARKYAEERRGLVERIEKAEALAEGRRDLVPCPFCEEYVIGYHRCKAEKVKLLERDLAERTRENAMLVEHLHDASARIEVLEEDLLTAREDRTMDGFMHSGDLEDLSTKTNQEQEVLRKAIEEADGLLWDAQAEDVEHTISCHSDTLPDEFRRVAKGSEEAHRVLQRVIQEVLYPNLG